MSTPLPPVQGQEPPMYLQRPSSARSQDISHVLVRTFRHLFTKEAVGPDTVQNLHTSRGGDDEYHEQYVAALKKVQEERDRRLAEASMLERHIMQAQARAMSADERELNRITSGYQQFPDLGLPPARSHFRSCIDTQLLRKHHLITPDDFATDEIPVVPAPRESTVPSYARETLTSTQKKSAEHERESSPLFNPEYPVYFSGAVSESSDSNLDSLPWAPDSGYAPRKDLWKQQMNPEQREQERTDLAVLNSKVDFLKNPRHIPPSAPGGGRSLIKAHKKKPKEIGIKPKLESEKSKEPSVIFVPNPPVVTFSDYGVGHVYEMTLELKNVTTTLRSVRVIPPKTTYFSVGLGQFPGDNGLVAPGMSCHYTIRFSPDSVGDFDDVLVVQTQSSTPLTIPIRGRRPPPVLTLSQTINVGECLVGGCKVGQYLVKNTGGPGRFCLMPRSSWPATNFKSIVSPGSVSLPPFDVRPAVFELSYGDCMMLEVLFSPQDVTEYTQEMIMVCDNCHVKHFTVTGAGQIAKVELDSVEGGLSEQQPGEICDVSAEYLVKFEDLNPFVYMQRTVVVKNPTDVDLMYNWIVVKPALEPPDPERTEVQLPEDRVEDVDSTFSVEPQSGVLKALGKNEFMLTFAPPEVNLFHSALHLVLRQIPVVPSTTVTENKAQGSAENGVRAQQSAKKLYFVEPTVQDMTALEIEVKGQCVPLEVIVQPYAVYIPGQLMVETSVKRPLRMFNNSMSSVQFEWENMSDKQVLEIQPPVGEIGPQCELDLELTVSGSVPGRINHTLYCYVNHMTEPLHLHIEAEIKGPEIVIENSDVNFGLVRLGETESRSITISNTCPVAAKWSLKVAHNEQKDDAMDECEFTFIPSSGEMAPLETGDIVVKFKPKVKKSVRAVFQLSVEDGNESHIAVRGEVQIPAVCLLSCELLMPEVYLDVPVCHQVTLLNQSLLDTNFEWGELEGSDAGMCSVSIHPQSGHLSPREQLQVDVQFTAHKQGEMSDLRLPCQVTGMDRPLYLTLSCFVQGLTVTYRTPKADESPRSQEMEDLLLDFGDSVKLGDNPKCYLHIRNNSAILAPFSITVEHFYSRPPSPPDKRPAGFMPTKSQRKAMLGRTPNLADPLSKTSTRAYSDLCKTILREGKGASFTVEPCTGVLQPFGEQIIEVSGFSDTWGHYEDRLICKIEKLDLVQIPMKMSVVGCPLQFQMVAAQPSQKPILRFGTHVSGVSTITRQMRINNSSPHDVRLDWKIFNVQPEDRQLLDFVVSFGESFPLRDAQGQEIVPPEEDDNEVTVPQPIQRYPTEMIPDSPDSTPAVSREVTRATTGVAVPPERRKVASVFVRRHDGVEKTNPYKVTPVQLVVPPKGSSVVNVSFTPFANADVVTGQDCLGYALGFMSLTKEIKEVPDKVIRPHGYLVEPLRLDMTAHVKPALLTLECTEDEGMRYRSAASDLMEDGQLASESLRLCSCMLTNHTETPLSFRLLSTEPFFIMQYHPANGYPMAQLLETNMLNLRPGQNIKVHVAFRVSLDLLEYLETLSMDTSQDGVTLECLDGRERRLHFNHDLQVEFNNNSVQHLPLFATLTVPSVFVTKDSLDFGVCLVGQERELEVQVYNPTGSASYWTAVLESKSDCCTKTTFTATPSSGMLEAHITHVSKSKTLVKVHFTAKHNESYEAVFLFHGMLGEEPRRLYVRGQGSYDGKHEALVNV